MSDSYLSALMLTALGLGLRTEVSQRWFGRLADHVMRTPMRRWMVRLMSMLWLGLAVASFGVHQGKASGDQSSTWNVVLVVVFIGLSRLLYNVPTWLFLAPAAALAIDAMADDHVGLLFFLGLAIVLTFVLYCLLRPIVRFGLMPRGLVRPTYWLAFYLGDFLTLERRSMAIVLALQAWRRSAARSAADLDFLYQRLLNEKYTTPTMLIASGLLQAARGRPEAARTWMSSVFWLTGPVNLLPHQRLAALWLAGEAATRGAWSEVEVCTRKVWVWPTLGFLRGIAQWRLQDPMRPTIEWLRTLAWIVPRALRSGLDLALAPVEASEADVTPPRIDNDPLGQALALHVHARQHADTETLVSLGLAWDAAGARIDLVPGLSVAESGDVQAQWGENVVSELMALLSTSKANLTQLGRCSGFLAQARRRLRDQLLRDLEARCDALHQRKEAKLKVAPVEEWEEWMNARVAYEQVLAQLGRESVHVVWGTWYVRICNYGVWLFNDRRERMLGHHIFRWLLEEATAMQDARAITLQTKNVKATRMWS